MESIKDILEQNRIGDVVSDNFEVLYCDDDILLVNDSRAFSYIASFYMPVTIFGFCQRGRISATINGKEAELREGQLIVCAPNTPIKDVMLSVDVQTIYLLVTNRALMGMIRPYIDVWNKTVVADRTLTYEIIEENIPFINNVFNALMLHVEKTKNDASPINIDITHSLIRTCMLCFCGALTLATEETRAVSADKLVAQAGNANSTFSDFLDLLQKEPQKHQPISYFADKLCVSPKHLSYLCKQNSGKTASEWIDEYILSDIVYYLSSTDIAIKEIADKIGFNNPSFFGKYVKKHLNCTPAEYRKKKTTK